MFFFLTLGLSYRRAFHGSGRSINVNGILICIPRMKLTTQRAGEGYFLGERKKVVFQGCSE